MAASRSLGTLTLDLIARIGGYEQGLDKAEREAKKRAKAIEKAFDGAVLGITAGFAAIGVGAVAVFAGFDRLITQAGNFQDIAEKIGGSAEGIASLAVAAGTAGTSMETITSASVRLTKGLTGVDDESKAAGAAVKALGLDLKEFKQLAPEVQLEHVAKALAGFEEGAGKTAVAVALFGKSGAELLPFLKALEEQGGRQVILTAEQIKQSDEFADKMARLKTETNLQAQALATQFIPLMTDAVDIVVDMGKAFVQSDAAAFAFNLTIGAFVTAFQTIAVLGANLAFVFETLGKEIGSVAAQWAAFARGDFDQIQFIRKAVAADTDAARKDLDAFEKRVMAMGQRDPLEYSNEGRNRPRRRLEFTGANSGAAKQSEADRYLESLQKQLDKTQDLTVQEQVLKDIQSGRLAGITPKIQEELLLLAKRIDAAKSLNEADKYVESLRKQVEKTEDLSAEEQVLRDIQAGRFKAAGEFSNAEVLRLAKIIDLTKEEGELLKLRRAASVAAGDALTKENEAYQKTLEQLLGDTASAKLQKQRDDVKLLTDEFEAGRISEQMYLEAVTARLDLMGEKLIEAKSFAEEFGLTFTSALEDAIVSGGKFSDVLKGIEKDILRILVRRNITEPLLKAFDSGGGIFDGVLKSIGNSISGIFSGGGFGSGSAFGNRDLGENFDGGGYTGSGPRIGGLDGKGGFMAMIHPQETVLDHTRGQGLGGGGDTYVFNGDFNRGQLIAAIQTSRTLAGQDAYERRRRGAF